MSNPRPAAPPRTGSTAGVSQPLSRGTTLGSASSDVERKKRSRNLLRDYYGLAGKAGDPLDIDLPDTFNAELYFTALSGSASLPDLLQRENELLMEIRELDGERQSLVYNHHHELIEASDTIRKMKSRALALDASLDSLKASFQSISQLADSLAPIRASLDTPRASTFPNSISTTTPTQATPPRRTAHGLPTLDEAPAVMSPIARGRSSTISQPVFDPPAISTPFDPLIHLPPLLALPTLLRALLAPNATETDSNPIPRRARATSSATINGNEPIMTAKTLWGEWEPAIRSWEEEGVEGVTEIGRACRDALRNGARRGSVSIRS